MPGTGIAADPKVVRHDTGAGHPEQPSRFSAVMNRLEWSGLARDMVRLPVRSATDDELALVHSREYIKLIECEVSEGRTQLSTGDTDICPESVDSARRAAGCAISAVDAVFSNEVANVFCPVRPPGHHANATRGMGFCLFNNVAIAARFAQHKYGVERIAIADWDVHHGNGTQDIFYDDGTVLFFSTHQSPWYPGTGDIAERGEGKGEGKTINCPFPAATPPSNILDAFRKILFPAARKFHPDLILLSAGFDSRINDPLGHFLLTDADFHELTSMMMDLAAQSCNGRLISVLEGGYNLEGLALATEAHVRALLGQC